MLYIISFPTRKPGYVRYKVGYASDVQKRFQQYEPESYLIGTKPGDVVDEQILHRRLRQVPGIKVIRSEWYLVPIGGIDIVKIFHEPRKRTEKLVLKTVKSITDVSSDMWERLRDDFPGTNNLDKNHIFKLYDKLSQVEGSEEHKILFLKLSQEKRLAKRLKILCEFLLKEGSDNNFILDFIPDSDRIKYFCKTLGPEVCRSLGYSSSDLSRKISIISFPDRDLRKGIYQEFSEGEKVLKSAAKDRLKEVYQRLNYRKTPKATDLKNFFEIKDYMITDPVSKKRVAGYELLRRLGT